MAAYVIANVEILDSIKFQEYASLVPATIEEYGGKYIIRGGEIEEAEGDWKPSRIVVIEFENMSQLKKWYHSQEYSGPMQLRHESSNTNAIFVEGV
tara:strand:- start:1045 stop:1332 length:288 start_codon:yes stop_codon:yes gene_type:complete